MFTELLAYPDAHANTHTHIHSPYTYTWKNVLKQTHNWAWWCTPVIPAPGRQVETPP